MKAKVINDFYGIKEGRDFAAGEVVELAKSRFNAIAKKLPGYIEAIEEEPEAEEATEGTAEVAEEAAEAPADGGEEAE